MRKKSLSFLLALCVLSFGTSASFALERSETLIVANPADAKNLDPAIAGDGPSMGLMLQIYEGLLRYDFDKQDVVPLLAEKWEQVDDLTYRFTLRDGVKFHNGETMRASDVKFCFERAMGPLGTGSKLYTDAIESVETPDERTVIFHLKAPYAPFITLLTLTWASVLSQKGVERLGENLNLDATGVGTGPYKFSSWQKGDRIVLDRFDDYWGKKAALKQIVMRAVPEAVNRTIELESGAVDISLIIHANDIRRISENPDLKVLRRLDYIVTYMGMNQRHKPLDDPKVREAIACALNVEALQKAVWQGTGRVPNGPLAWEARYADHDLPLPVQDVERAKRLLEEAGVKDLELKLWTADRKERVDAATIIQGQLAEVGIKVDIQVMEWGAFLDGLLAGRQQLFILGSGFSDPGLTVKALYYTDGSANYTHVDDKTLNELTDRSLALPDGPERAKLFADIQRRLAALRPAVYLNDEEYLVGAARRVEGFQPGPRGYHSFVDVYFAK